MLTPRAREDAVRTTPNAEADAPPTLVHHPRPAAEGAAEAARRAWVPGAPRPIDFRPDRDQAPGWPLFATEVSRAAVDYAAWEATKRVVVRRAPRGDGHPVLVLPGLLASDGSTRPLRAFLDRLGYHAHGWGLGRNIGPTARTMAGLLHVYDDMLQTYGRAGSVIGWSLGGIFAREIARDRADSVRQAIVLGSPFRLAHPSQTRAMRAFDRYSHMHVPVEELPPAESTRPPLPVPSTSIYSELDGIVHWRACLDEPGEGRENIAVHSSHLGLGHNPAALWAIADRLGQPEGVWRPFRAPGWGRALYPAPGEPVAVMV